MLGCSQDILDVVKSDEKTRDQHQVPGEKERCCMSSKRNSPRPSLILLICRALRRKKRKSMLMLRVGAPNCEGPEGPKAAGFHTTARAQTCTFQGPGLQTPPKFQRKDPPRERRKNEICDGRAEKRAKFWLSGGRGSGEGRSPSGRGVRGSTHENLEQPPQQPQQPHNNHTTQHNTTHNTNWAKNGLAKNGQKHQTPILVKIGLAKVGHDRAHWVLLSLEGWDCGSEEVVLETSMHSGNDSSLGE